MRKKNVDNPKINHISLCSGYGGIDLGLSNCIANLRTIAYSEIEACAIETLLARMEEEKLDAAPIWSDLKSFPWEQFSGMVDILSGGYPCQPFSTAGKREGQYDPRHLWPWIADGIRVMRPKICFFENVQGHVTLGLPTVISDLEELGYKVSWGIFSAEECNLPHKRARVFILANSVCERRQLSFKWKQSTKQMFGSQSSSRRNWKTWQVEPTICGNDDGSSNRVDRLRLLGNGVVPETAELAFRALMNNL